MFTHEEGNETGLARAPRPANAISFDSEQIILFSVHVCTCVNSLVLVSELAAVYFNVQASLCN